MVCNNLEIILIVSLREYANVNLKLEKHTIVRAGTRLFSLVSFDSSNHIFSILRFS